MYEALVLSTTGTPRPELLAFLRSVPGLRLLEVPEDTLPPTPDLVILDASGPGHGPVARLRALRAWLPDVRCIVLVSATRDLVAARCAGADQVLLAGFSAEEFRHALATLLQRGVQKA